MNHATITRVALAVLRTIVFLSGMVFGFLTAAVVSSFGGSAAVDFSGVFFGIGLFLAAPICWIAAIYSRAGDRWTLVYVSCWAVYFITVVIIDVYERGRPITPANNAGGLAILVLGVLYLVVLPIGVLIFRRRRHAGDR